MTRLTRRTLLRAGAAFAGTAAIGCPSISQALPDAIRIGHLTPLTGFLGNLGSYAQLGIRMAQDEINAAGGVMGRPLDVMSEDSINPTTAAAKAQRMLERDGATVLMGEINSASAQAIMQVAAHSKRLYMQIGGRSDELRARSCNRYSFHVDIPSTTEVNVVGRALLRDNMMKGRTFSTITADYLFGHDLARAARGFLDGNGGRLVDDQRVATDVSDFRPYLAKIRTAKPDMVCANLIGTQLTNLVRQYAASGLTSPIVGFNLNTADVWAAGEGHLSGTWPTVWYHTLDVPASKAFVANFIKRYGKVPENHAWIEYVSLKMMARAMAETRSTDTETLIGYFEKETPFDILKARQGYFRKSDHQLMQEAYPFTVRATKASGDTGDITSASKESRKDLFDMMALGAAVPAPDEPLDAIAMTSTQPSCTL
jgi:branched-chain amino acid transport system substrate-binding protein